MRYWSAAISAIPTAISTQSLTHWRNSKPPGVERGAGHSNGSIIDIFHPRLDQGSADTACGYGTDRGCQGGDWFADLEQLFRGPVELAGEAFKARVNHHTGCAPVGQHSRRAGESQSSRRLI
jgi:hypothetical protein